MASPYAFVTLLASDSYLPGALALAAALKDVHSSPAVHPEVDFQTVCLVTPENVDVSTIKLLRRAFNVVIGVEIIASEDDKRLKLLGRPDLNTVLTKLHVFRLTQYSKIIFLDADVLPVRPISHLFTLPHEFSAVPDVGWPDIFNSGVMVLSPGQEKFDALSTLLKSKGSWDGGDQGILNEWRGNDWNRLSFTYNTTPSASYTYAPAYERFGSDISAIHFIGPNKPWNTLPFRPPGSTSTNTGTGQPHSYNYDSLVDRWYDVYDRHYRSQVLVSKAEFEVRRYTSAWDTASAPIPLSASAPVISALGLEDLRRIAIEGVSTSSVPVTVATSRPEGEGEYQSMPLDGRVDLMRQKEEQLVQQPEKVEELPSTPKNWHINLPARSPPLMETLPTPAPDELPPTPHINLLALPPSMPPTPTPAGPSQPKDLVEQGIQHEEGIQNQLQEELQRSHLKNEPPRPISPPLLSWNPAVESPPKTAPPASTFPSNTYFTNAWDHSKRPHVEAHPSQASTMDSAGFFQPPPPSEIPESLLRQGHYRRVTGGESGATPSPDRKKVKAVFPWEGEPRHLPGRVFPPSDTPPPENFLPLVSPSRVRSTSTPERQATHMYATPSPLSGLPSPLNYANAWDAVPSIQKYAGLLARTPPSPPALLAPAFDVGQRRSRSHSFKTWSERLEANSRDGDDEDSEDEISGEDDAGTIKSHLTEKNAKRSATSGRPRKSVKLVSVGVQTVPRDMKSQGVQVSTGPAKPVRPPRFGLLENSNGRRSWPPVTSTATVRPVLSQGLKAEPDARGVIPSPSTTSAKPTTVSNAPPTPQFSRDLSEDRSPPVLSPSAPLKVKTQIVTPPSKTMHTQAPSSINTVDSPSIPSPISSLGPLSPQEGQPISSPPTRKGGRVWDPATGVELFKRGSEEVLARFLKMGSWDEDSHSRS